MRRHDGRCVVEAKVGLQAVFGAKIRVTELIFHGALVHSVRSQFAEVWSTEAARHVQPEVHLLIYDADGAKASRQSRNVAAQPFKHPFERIAVQVAVVQANATAQREPAVGVSGGAKASYVEKLIGWYEVFVSLVERPLPHSRLPMV